MVLLIVFIELKEYIHASTLHSRRKKKTSVLIARERFGEIIFVASVA